MKKVKRIGWFLPMLLVAQVTYGQLLKVNQTVFGMDCAPCAHGVQEGLQKMAGIHTAKVSLNDGKAFITLAPVNRVTLSAIQKDITDNGFSPRQAEVEMKGVVKKINGKLAVQVQNEIFWIDDHSNASALTQLKDKLQENSTTVTLSGIAKNEEEQKRLPPVWQLSLTKVL